MKHLLLSVIALTLVAPFARADDKPAGPPATAPSAKDQKDQVYEDKEDQLRITAPASWKRRQTAEPLLKIVFTVGGGPGGDARVPTFEVAVNAGHQIADNRLAEAVKALRASEERRNNTLGEDEPVALGGAKAVRFTFTGKDNGQEVKGSHVVAIRHGTLYIITFIADPATFAAKDAEARKVVDSVKWTDAD